MDVSAIVRRTHRVPRSRPPDLARCTVDLRPRQTSCSPGALVSPPGWPGLVVTLPTAATVGALASSIAITGTVGVWAVALGGVVLGAGIYAASRRDPVTALNVNDLPVPPLAQTAA